MKLQQGLFATLTLALLLGACSPAEDTTEGSTPDSETAAAANSTATEASNAPEAAEASAESTNTDTLVIMQSADIPTKDPTAMTDSASISVMKNVYDTLITYTDSSLTDYEPLLATAWNISDDGLTYRFDLREGVKFHSGNPFTCRDMEYTFERAMGYGDQRAQ